MSNKQQNYATLIILSFMLIIGVVIPLFTPELVAKMFSLWDEHGAVVKLWVNSIASSLLVLQIITLAPLKHKRDLTASQITIMTLIYILGLAIASIPARVIFGLYPSHDISETVTNTVLCLLLFMSRKRISKLIDE